jgi:hypothetical protein
MLKAGLASLALTVIFLGCSRSGKDEVAGDEVTVPELNRALAMWKMQYGTYPKAVDELTNSPAVQGRRLPRLPAGQKLVIDASNHTVVIEKE